MRAWFYAVALVAATVSKAVFAAEPVEAPAFAETFADGSRWNARPGITLLIEATTGCPGGRSLHFRGCQELAWDGATSSPFPLQAREKYRLTAWLRLADGFSGPPPFLKVQLLGARENGEPDPGQPHGQRSARCCESSMM